MLKTKPRLAVIASHPIQHFVPVYQRLAEHFDVELKVFYIAENGVADSVDKGFGVSFSWDIPLLENYDHLFLHPGKILDQYSFSSLDCVAINQHMDEFAANAIWIHGYAAKVNWRTILGQSHKRSIIYSSDSNLLTKRIWVTQIFKQIAVRFFFSKCSMLIAISEPNELYLKHYGVPTKKIKRSCFPVDIQRLTKQRKQLSASNKNQIRYDNGIAQDAFVLLFSGKLVDYKGVLDLVRARALLAAEEIVILFMGDGELRNKIMQLAKELGINDKVSITGFVNQSKIAHYMFASDVLVLPSTKEPFGAVISEALPFGLPIIASNKVGAVGKTDSAQPNKNTLVYQSGNIEELAWVIKKLYQDRDLYKRFSEHSKAIAMQHDVDVYCQTIVDCLKTKG